MGNLILDITSLTGEALGDVMVRGDGYCLLTNHGINQSIIDNAFSASRRFHALPIEQKLALQHRGDFKGYQPVDSQISHEIGRVDDEQLLPNRNESIFFKRSDNVWPSDLSGFREDVEAAANALENLTQRMIPAYADMLGVERKRLQSMFPHPLYYTLRLTRYPSMDHEPGRYGLAGHRDTSFLTLLCQDGTQGLSVRDRHGVWHDLPGDADKIVLVCGLQLHKMSYGEVVAAPHKVVGGIERYAMPFFVMAEGSDSL